MISDSGCGIPEHLMLQIFNPYFTTKGASSGTGMGLYMSKMIVEKEMNGELLGRKHRIGGQIYHQTEKNDNGKAIHDYREDEKLPDLAGG